MVKLFLPLILLVLASLVLAIKTAQVYKDKEIILSQIKVKDAVDAQSAKPVSDTDLITARQMVEGYAALYSLPVEVKLEKRNIRITVLHPKVEEGATAVKEDDSKKFAVLSNFQNVIGFFTSLSTLPYPLEYREFCVGTECPSVFDVTIAAKGQQAPPQSAPAPAPAPGKPAVVAPLPGPEQIQGQAT